MQERKIREIENGRKGSKKDGGSCTRAKKKKNDIAQADTFAQPLKLPREKKEQVVTKEVRK